MNKKKIKLIVTSILLDEILISLRRLKGETVNIMVKDIDTDVCKFKNPFQIEITLIEKRIGKDKQIEWYIEGFFAFGNFQKNCVMLLSGVSKLNGIIEIEA